MARSRQRRKEAREAVNARAAGGVAEELVEEADTPPMPGDESAEQVTVTGPDDAPERSFAEAEAEPFAEDVEEEGEYEDVSPAELIATIGPLRRTRRHPLIVGIRMFTAMLEEARGGYAADRLGQMEEALGIDFNALEQDGILQIAMAAMDEAGVPDVEHGVQMALEARAATEENGIPVAEDHGDGATDLGPDVETETAAELDDEDEFGDAPGPDEA